MTTESKGAGASLVVASTIRSKLNNDIAVQMNP
jgi:hypothetical protein